MFLTRVICIIVVVIHAVDTIRVNAFRLLGGRGSVFIVSEVHHLLDVLVLLFEAQQFLLQVVDGTVEVVRTVVQHAHALVAAGLVVEHDDDHVSVHLFALVRIVFQNLLRAFQALESAFILLVLEGLDAGVVEPIQHIL